MGLQSPTAPATDQAIAMSIGTMGSIISSVDGAEAYNLSRLVHVRLQGILAAELKAVAPLFCFSIAKLTGWAGSSAGV